MIDPAVRRVAAHVSRSRARQLLSAVALAAAAWIAMSELNRLIAGITVGGASYSASELYGPSWLPRLLAVPEGEIAPWEAAVEANEGNDWAPITDLLVLHAAADVLFIIGYTWFLLSLVRAEADDAFRRAVGLFVVLLAGVDVAENLAAAQVFLSLEDGTLSSLEQLHAWTVAKWVFAAIVAVLLLWRAEAAWRFVKHLLVALWFQRFSVVVVAMLALLMASTEGEIQEQLPDVQRSWMDGGQGVAYAVLAFIALCLLTVQMLFLGRQRSEKFSGLVVETAADPTGVDSRKDPTKVQMVRTWGLFVVGAVLVVIAERLTAVAISYERFFVFVLVPLGVLGASKLASTLVRWPWFQQRLLGGRKLDEVPSRRWSFNKENKSIVSISGDALAGAVVAVAGIGLVRAFIAPAVLVPGRRAGSWILVAVGLLLAAGIWFGLWVLLPWLLRKMVERWPGRTNAVDHAKKGSLASRPVRYAAWTVIAIQVVATVWLLLWPLTAPRWLGVTAAVLVVLGAMTSLLTWVTLVGLRTRPLELFRILRFRVTPVITMVVLVAFAAGTVDNPDEHHTVRTLNGVSFDDRPDLAETLDTWASARADTGCLFDVPRSGSLRATPMVLVAAAGGGIRATWWTASAISKLTEGNCGEHAVFLSSGVSGGSVGLAVADVTAEIEGALNEMAEQDALAAAASSMITGDLLHALTGITLRPIGLPPGEGTSQDDRAALMELTWENKTPALKNMFGSGISGSHRAGQLILNSTSVTSGCRVFVSTVRIASDGRAAAADNIEPVAPECGSKRSGAIVGTYDLLDAYFKDGCLDALSSTTASLISARFPYLTPTGVTGDCDGLAKDQLVDGGYSEGSGLGTLNDISPELMTAVREHNAAVMSDTGDGVLLVPFTVFLENHFNLDLQVDPPGHELEALAPITTSGAAPRRLTSSNALLQRVATATHDWLSCADDDSRCRATVQAVDNEWTSRIVVVAPESEPRVEAPLGWVLSELSRTSLMEALAQTSRPCGAEPDEFRCPQGVWRLGDLTEALKGNR